MKYILLADIHLTVANPVCRKDDVRIVQMEKLRFIFDFARSKEAAVVVAGDFLDSPRSWYIVIEVLDFLDEYADVPVYAVYGQHDMYYYSDKTKDATTLGVLIKSGRVTLLDETVTEVDGWDWYGCSFGQPVPKPFDSPRMKGLAIHAGIAKMALWPGQVYQDATKFLLKHSEYDIVLCGDIHNTFVVEEFSTRPRYIMNPGPMMRLEANEHMLKHTPMFYFLDDMLSTHPITGVGIPHAKSDICMSREHLTRIEDVSGVLDDFVSSVKAVDLSGRGDLVQMLSEFIIKNKIEQDIVDILSWARSATDE